MQTYGLEKRVNAKNCPHLMVKKLRLKRNHISRKKYARHEGKLTCQRFFNDFSTIICLRAGVSERQS